MQDIQLKDAKATLSAVVDQALAGQSFAITRHGRKQAVIISWEAWERLAKVPSFAELLLNSPLEEGDIPERDQSPPRTPEF